MAHTRKHPAPTGDSWRQHRCMGWHKGVASQDTPQEIQVRNTDDYPCTNGNGHIHSPQVFNVGWCGDPIPRACLEPGSVTLQGIWSHAKNAEFAKFFYYHSLRPSHASAVLLQRQRDRTRNCIL